MRDSFSFWYFFIRRKHKWGKLHFGRKCEWFWTTELLIKWTGDRVLHLQACQQFCICAKVWERAKRKLRHTHLNCLSYLWGNLGAWCVCTLCRNMDLMTCHPQQTLWAAPDQGSEVNPQQTNAVCVCASSKTIIWICSLTSDSAKWSSSPQESAWILQHTYPQQPSAHWYSRPGALQSAR